jgi:hypothetical protein
VILSERRGLKIDNTVHMLTRVTSLVYLQTKEVGHVAKQHVGNVTQLVVAQTPEKEKKHPV